MRLAGVLCVRFGISLSLLRSERGNDKGELGVFMSAVLLAPLPVSLVFQDRAVGDESSSSLDDESRPCQLCSGALDIRVVGTCGWLCDKYSAGSAMPEPW